MVDPNLLVRQYLMQNTALLAMLGSYQVTAHLPEKFDPLNGPIVVVGTEGGTSHPEIPIQTQRVKVRVWAGVDGYATARAVYGIVHDWLHGQNDLDFGDLGTILASIETVTGQDITDPDSGWATVLAYYDVTVRDGAFTDLSGTFQQGSQTKAYIDAAVAAALAQAEAYTDSFVGGAAVRFANPETPTGTINGTDGTDGNAVFTLLHPPNPAAQFPLTKNGQVMYQGTAYTLSGSTITYLSGYIPISGDTHATLPYRW